MMYPVVRQPHLQDYQPGDLQGLSLVGAQQPCLAARGHADEEPTREIILD